MTPRADIYRLLLFAVYRNSQMLPARLWIQKLERTSGLHSVCTRKGNHMAGMQFLGRPIRRAWTLKWYFSLRGRSAAAMRSGSRNARPGAGRKRPRAPRLSQPDAVLSSVPGNDRGDAGRDAPQAAVGKGGMAVVSYATFGNRYRFPGKLWIT